MIYIGSRNPLTIIVMAGLFLAGALFAKQWMDAQPDIVDETFTTAKVVSIEKKSLTHSDKTGGDITTNIAIAKLALEDGKTFNSTVFQPYPDVGENIPVKVMSYSDGSVSASALRD